MKTFLRMLLRISAAALLLSGCAYATRVVRDDLGDGGKGGDGNVVFGLEPRDARFEFRGVRRPRDRANLLGNAHGRSIAKRG